MAKYTLKTFCGSNELERFENRNPSKLISVLIHPRFDRSKQDPYDLEKHADRFEIYDSHRFKLFSGRIDDAIAFVDRLK